MAFISRINSGDIYFTKAHDINAIADVVNQLGRTGGSGIKRGNGNTVIISAYNASSDYDIEPYMVVGILDGETDYSIGGCVPVVPYDGTQSSWGIAINGIPKDGEVGSVAIGGVFTCKLSGEYSSSKKYASPSKSNPSVLEYSESGNIKLLGHGEGEENDDILQFVGIESDNGYSGYFKIVYGVGVPGGYGNVSNGQNNNSLNNLDNSDSQDVSSGSNETGNKNNSILSGLSGNGVLVIRNGQIGVMPIGSCEDESESSSPSSSSSEPSSSSSSEPSSSSSSESSSGSSQDSSSSSSHEERRIIKVIDGANPDSSICGYVFHGTNRISVYRVGFNEVDNAYIWVEWNGTDAKINFGSSLPMPRQDWHFVLIGRIVNKKIIQEHHGLVYYNTLLM